MRATTSSTPTTFAATSTAPAAATPLNVAHPRVMRMVLDSLRHWVTAYGVAGFRFDLATSLGRAPSDFSPQAAFFQAVQQDPVLSRVKLIAEPWDIGGGGYQLGGYPYGWSEWNDQFRDNLRGFWRGDSGTLAKLTQGLSGSREIFLPSGRSPLASINFVASHDGYTLADVVAYEEKHNEANGEENRDGHGHNLSANYGVEGADRRSRHPGPTRPAEAQHAGLRVLRAGRADAADGRRAIPHAIRQQQRLLPGRRIELDGLGERPRSDAHRVRGEPRCAPPGLLFPAAAALPRRQPRRRDGPEGRALALPRWDRDGRGRLGRRRTPCLRHADEQRYRGLGARPHSHERGARALPLRPAARSRRPLASRLRHHPGHRQGLRRRAAAGPGRRDRRSARAGGAGAEVAAPPRLRGSSEKTSRASRLPPPPVASCDPDYDRHRDGIDAGGERRRGTGDGGRSPPRPAQADDDARQ
ncbi:protein of unknown function [Methylorubrum extorquens]|uniref:Glycosyl hydrolase family 13 catalytic domain-containing protein n=1 Tax=Methylorubrum extorquens TaxID=408 RepID=A0A2N9AUQ7_METEX|nr:protein of unknown function [Methylorubrum extorquens]